MPLRPSVSTGLPFRGGQTTKRPTVPSMQMGSRNTGTRVEARAQWTSPPEQPLVNHKDGEKQGASLVSGRHFFLPRDGWAAVG